MEVYLVRHGEATSEAEDPLRPLSQRGRLEVTRVARAAARAGVSVGIVCHSGKLRARQTAEILAEHLEPGKGTSAIAGLAPHDDPEAARRLIEQATEPVVLVGHLPHLSRLVSLLLVGEPGREIVTLHAGGIAALGRREAGWRLLWLMSPEIVPQS